MCTHSYIQYSECKIHIPIHSYTHHSEDENKKHIQRQVIITVDIDKEKRGFPMSRRMRKCFSVEQRRRKRYNTDTPLLLAL